jgi:U3 small nucleolar RNA-associated protein 12
LNVPWFGSVMAVQFVPKTHYIFSAGKDGVLKYWDADKFELLLTLEGHHAEVWCLAVSPHGDFVVTGSHDRSIRRWDRTEEPFFIEVNLTLSNVIVLLCFVLTYS